MDFQTWYEGSSSSWGLSTPDFEKGFIRAVTMSYDDLIKYGSEKAVKEAGRLREEGKEYIVQDGDIMEFHLLHHQKTRFGRFITETSQIYLKYLLEY